MDTRALEVELLFNRIPNLACFGCKEPYRPYAGRYMGGDGLDHHFVLATCEGCQSRTLLTFYVEDPQRSLAPLSGEAQMHLRRETALRDLLGRAEAVRQRAPGEPPLEP